jgi:hypothetical protein
MYVTWKTSQQRASFKLTEGRDGPNTPGNLVGTVYGADRTGGSVGAVERTKADQNTLWAATGTGRIFVTKDATHGRSAWRLRLPR